MAAQPQGEAFGRRARLGDAAACRPRGPVSQRPRRERKRPVGQMLYRPRKVGPTGRYEGLCARSSVRRADARPSGGPVISTRIPTWDGAAAGPAPARSILQHVRGGRFPPARRSVNNPVCGHMSGLRVPLALHSTLHLPSGTGPSSGEIPGSVLSPVSFGRCVLHRTPGPRPRPMPGWRCVRSSNAACDPPVSCNLLTPRDPPYGPSQARRL